MKKSECLIVSSIFTALHFCLVFSLNATADVIHFGVLPSTSTSNIEELSGGLALGLAKVFEKPIELKTRPSFEDYFDALRNGEFDLAFVQPFDLVQLEKLGTDYIPVARFSDPLVAVFVTKNPEITSIKNLSGKKIALPPIGSAVSILALRELDAQKTKVEHIRYYSEHLSCLQAVLIGEAEACAVAKEILHHYLYDRDLSLRVFYESAEIPNVSLVTLKKHEKLRKDLIEYMVSLGDSEVGSMLKDKFSISGFVPAFSSDFNFLEEIYDEHVESTR